ncbi:MAG: SHOCT domain-containing protein [Phycisphaerae bacterium]|nr:SHOCT domain-containing protein [Phycisphaerae bacterium]
MVAALTPAASVIVWGLVLMAVLVLVGSALELGRRRWLASSQRRSEARGGGFSIERVEALHRRGLISDEEFQRLRRQALGLPTVGRAPPSGSSSPPAGDDGNAGRNG